MAEHQKLAVMSFDEQVRYFANQKPFRKVVFPPVKVAFGPDDVETDGKGNVISMPPLIERPCFGRVEYMLRHRRKVQPKKTLADGREVENHSKCERCGVRKACLKLVRERMVACSQVVEAVSAWDRNTKHLGGNARFVGPLADNFWEPVKRAIIARGPFASSNDQVIVDALKNATDRQREMWRAEKRKQRNVALQDPREPDIWTIEAAPAERDRRADFLKGMLSSEDGPKRLGTWGLDTCEKVADAWMAMTVLRANRAPCGDTHIARWLIEAGRAEGKELGAMRQRVIKDLDKIEYLYDCGLWSRQFDPLGPNYDPDLNPMLVAAGMTPHLPPLQS